MSQRYSGYGRRPEDFYETPPWVTHALQPQLKGVRSIWDPASGKLAMSNVLATWPGVQVRATDIAGGLDFLQVDKADHDAIVCNPPYTIADRFIEHALKLTKPYRGRVAMLLRTDFDHAKGRRWLFGGSSTFACKLVLTPRIRWFEEKIGNPSYNHAWFIWDWTNIGPPVLRYFYEDTLSQRARDLKQLWEQA